MKIHHWKRETCRLCGSKNLEKVLDLHPVPIGEKYSATPFTEEAQRFPIDLYNCKECQCIQVLDNIDQDFLWSEYTYFSGQTDSIVDHQDEFADYVVNNFNFGDSSKILDIGSNDGTLLSAFKKRGFEVFGVDPAETVARVATENGIDTLVSLFSDKIITELPDNFRQLDLVTAFNVFAHSDDMDGMIKGVTSILKPEGVFCFEVQYLVPILDKFLLGTIFHEHMIHYSVTSAKNFLEKNGMKIVDLQTNNIQKGSIIFYTVRKENPILVQPIVSEFLDNEASNGYLDGTKFISFAENIENCKSKIYSLKEKINKESLSLAGFGAARSGPTLAIQFDLENCISFLIDDHPSKQNKYAPFENLKVESSDSISILKPDYIVILAWIHTKRIVKQNINYLENGGIFITLWPNYNEINSSNYQDWLNEET